MENYIVRIYRRDDHDPDRVAGLLESVEQQTQQPFNTLVALQTLLTKPAHTSTNSEAFSKNNKRSAVAD